MDEYAVDLLPAEVLRWVRADAERTAPQLWVRASKTYAAETEFDREIYGVGDDDDVRLVSIEGLLEISPQGGADGWTLALRAEDVVGLVPGGAEEGYENEDDLPLDAFEEQFLIPEKGEVEVLVLAEDAGAWTRFHRWLTRMRAEMPAG